MFDGDIKIQLDKYTDYVNNLISNKIKFSVNEYSDMINNLYSFRSSEKYLDYIDYFITIAGKYEFHNTYIRKLKLQKINATNEP